MKKIFYSLLLLLSTSLFSAGYKPVHGEIDNWQNHGYNTQGYIIRCVDAKNPRVEIVSPQNDIIFSLSQHQVKELEKQIGKNYSTFFSNGRIPFLPPQLTIRLEISDFKSIINKLPYAQMLLDDKDWQISIKEQPHLMAMPKHLLAAYIKTRYVNTGKFALDDKGQLVSLTNECIILGDPIAQECAMYVNKSNYIDSLPEILDEVRTNIAKIDKSFNIKQNKENLSSQFSFFKKIAIPSILLIGASFVGYKLWHEGWSFFDNLFEKINSMFQSKPQPEKSKEKQPEPPQPDKIPVNEPKQQAPAQQEAPQVQNNAQNNPVPQPQPVNPNLQNQAAVEEISGLYADLAGYAMRARDGEENREVQALTNYFKSIRDKFPQDDVENINSLIEQAKYNDLKEHCITWAKINS